MRHNYRGEKGFSLVELLVALGIIVILTIIAIPSIDPIINTSNANSAANAIKYSIMSARNSAIAKNQSTSVWAIVNDVMEIGEIEVPPGTPIVWSNVTVDIDSADTALLVNPAQYWTGTPDSTYYATHWTRMATATYGGVGTYAWFTASSTALARWYSPQIAAGYSGSFTIEAFVRRAATDRATEVQYVASLADSGQSFTSTPFQTTHYYTATQSAWITLQTITVPQLTTPSRVKIEISKYGSGAAGTYPIIWVDALRLNGTLNPYTTTSGTTFTIGGKTWPINKWQGAYVTILNPDDPITSENEKGVIIARVASSTADTITANVTHWQRKNEATGDMENVDIADGAIYLLQFANPEDVVPALSIGSGSGTAVNWTNMPKGISVSIYDAVYTNRRVLPLMFDSTGKATFTNADGYITLKLYATESPSDQSAWRFLRVWKNTGRTRIARTIAELD